MKTTQVDGLYSASIDSDVEIDWYSEVYLWQQKVKATCYRHHCTWR